MKVVLKEKQEQSSSSGRYKAYMIYFHILHLLEMFLGNVSSPTSIIVYLFVCVCACVRACVRACVYNHSCVNVCVHAMYILLWYWYHLNVKVN